MLTRRGALLATAAPAAAVAGRVFGIAELTMVAVAAAVVVAAGVGYVRSVGLAVSAERVAAPARPAVGAEVRVDVAVRNVGRRRTPALWAAEPIDGGRAMAGFPVGPLAPGGSRRACYRLTAERRGELALGPLELRLTDPFGVARRRVAAAPAAALVVVPCAWPVDVALAGAGGRGDGAGAGRGRPAVGGDFRSLRDYELGDDLRRVSWTASARRGAPVVREDVEPPSDRATVVLDTRPAAHDGDSFEAAVSAAAGIVAAGVRAGLPVRLVAGAVATPFGAGAAHLSAVLDLLARVEPAGSGPPPALARPGAGRRGGSLVLVTTPVAGPGLAGAVARLHGPSRALTVVTVPRAGAGPGAFPAPPGATVVALGPGARRSAGGAGAGG